MTKIDDWFIEVDELPKLTKEARNIKCLRDLIVRDKVPPTRDEGKVARVKGRSRIEIAFIYFYLNREQFGNYDGEERIAVIKKRVGYTWPIDEAVWTAIAELEEDLVNIEDKIIDNFEVTLQKYARFLKQINKRNDRALLLLERASTEDETFEVSIEIDRLMDKSRDDIKWILDATNQMKVTFKNLEELRVLKNVKGRKRKGNELELNKDLYERKHDV